MKDTERRDYISTFDPKYYLEQYFGEPDEEDTFTYQFISKALQELPDGLLALEFGGGPTLYAVAVLAWRAAQIHFCDFLESNLAEVQLWLQDDPNAYDWRPHIQAALESQGLPNDAQAIEQRQSKMRRITSILSPCDACAEAPLPDAHEKYDLVCAMHCTDVAAANVAEWRQVLANVSSLVKPGGWLLLGVTTGAEINTVNHKTFSCANLRPADIHAGLLHANYLPDSIQMQQMPVPDDYSREYNGVLMAVAQKAD